MARRRRGAAGSSRDGARRGTGVRQGAGGSRTMTAQPSDGEEQVQASAPTLRLHLTRRRRVRFTHDTHDNEHENKKSSKSCCIFHKPRAWDESSTESEDDGGAESDGSSSSDGGPSRKPVRRKPPNDRDRGGDGPKDESGGDERS